MDKTAAESSGHAGGVVSAPLPLVQRPEKGVWGTGRVTVASRELESHVVLS
jgi:hypothetical protein